MQPPGNGSDQRNGADNSCCGTAPESWLLWIRSPSAAGVRSRRRSNRRLLDMPRLRRSGCGLSDLGCILAAAHNFVASFQFPLASREDARRALGIGWGPLVVTIGRLTAQKNPSAFLEIIQRLHERRPDVRAIWVGSGSRRGRLPALIKAARMEGVIRVADWQHDVRKYIAAADVILSPSKFESFGYVAAEALSMNRPVVASDITGTRDIMRGALQEWLYPADEPERAAQLLFQLLRCPDQAATVGHIGRDEIKAPLQQRADARHPRRSLSQNPRSHSHARRLIQTKRETSRNASSP